VFLQSLQNQATEETFSSQRNNPQVVFCCFFGALFIAGATARNHQQVSNGYELLGFLLDGDSQMMSDGIVDEDLWDVCWGLKPPTRLTLLTS